MSSAIAELYGDDQAGPSIDDGERKFTVADMAPFDSSTPYLKEKVRACKIVANRPEGAFIGKILDDLHGRDRWESGGKRYQRVRRFLSSHPRFFRVSRSDGLIFCQPTLALLDLIKRGIIQTPGESPQRDGSRDWCEHLLRSIAWDGEEAINERGRELLEQNLTEYVDRINDLRLILHSEEAEPEYLSLPYKTRFNDANRISKQHALLGKELEKAGEWYDYAVLLTLTTDPKKFSSVWEMWCGDPNDPRDTGINGNWNRLMSWFASDSRLGERPDYVKVLEATEKGFPHLHAIVFLDEDQVRDYDGMPYLEDKSAISDYWGKYQGRIVDTQPLIWQDELPDEYDADEGWVRWDEDGDHGGSIEGDGGDVGGQTAGEYLGKYLSAIYGGIRQTAGLGGGGGQQVVTDGGRDLPADELDDVGKYDEKAATWKVAMYWATRRKIRTESRDLRQAVEEDHEDETEEKAEIAEQIRRNRYEFVGAWREFDLPDHIRNGLVDVDSLLDSLDDELEHVNPAIASDPPPKSRLHRLKRRFPSSAWPLLEGLHGGDRD